jgi:hypothetical protein
MKEPEPQKTPRREPGPYEPEIEPPRREPDRQPGRQAEPEIQVPGIHEAPDPDQQPPGMPGIIA